MIMSNDYKELTHAGPLLYLNPEKAIRLNELLNDLEDVLLGRSSGSVELHSLRKELYGLVFSLSPLSRTRRLVSEILELTHEKSALQKDNIAVIKSLLRQIYAPSCSVLVFKDRD